MVWFRGYFDILNRLSVTHECDEQTERRTDMLLANAALNYVTRPKSEAAFTTDATCNQVHFDSVRLLQRPSQQDTSLWIALCLSVRLTV